MATFKVGQRVRIVGVPRTMKKLGNLPAVGREATVTCRAPHPTISAASDYAVRVDGWPSPHINGEWGVKASDIAPLTGPSEECESIRQLKPLTVRETA